MSCPSADPVTAYLRDYGHTDEVRAVYGDEDPAEAYCARRGDQEEQLSVASDLDARPTVRTVPDDFGFVPGPDGGGYPDEYKEVAWIALRKAAGIVRISHITVIAEWNRRGRDIDVFAVLSSMVWRPAEPATHGPSEVAATIWSGSGARPRERQSRQPVQPLD